jgi:HEAT repeat protein
MEILNDETEEAVLRRYACYSLGELGNEKALDSIIKAYSDSDPNLRIYAIEALKNFNNEQTKKILIQSLRDSFWRIRISSIDSIGRLKIEEAVPNLIYMAKKEPEAVVRTKAVETLGLIPTAESFAFLKETAESSAVLPRYRFAAVETLFKNNFDAGFPVIEKLIIKEWEVKDSKLLEHISKLISLKEAAVLEKTAGLFLDHKNLIIRLHGLQCIKLNRFASYKEKLEELAKEGNPAPVRKAALTALESL